ncbi:hypothetical protein Lalb_Chr14g0367661 [Lupinus albus]|uniref:Uncharacterized protein n=1 Tax=Lupinus albus TaxID=3870 RepID=A0A6A4PET8_LUPAL|nr:hypothetical protein Lalb_Chr14g0367661 [Lupinus albus]
MNSWFCSPCKEGPGWFKETEVMDGNLAHKERSRERGKGTLCLVKMDSTIDIECRGILKGRE